MKRLHIIVLLLSLSLLAACGGGAATPTPPADQPPVDQPGDSAPPSDDGGDASGGDAPADAPSTGDTVVEEKAIINAVAAAPADSSVAITINGDFRDGCYTLDHVAHEVEEGNIVRLHVYTAHPEEAECTEALVPFTTDYVVDVSDWPDGLYVVDAYGTMTQFTLGESAAEPGTAAEGCAEPGDGETLLTERGPKAAYCFVLPAGFTTFDTGIEGIVSVLGPTVGEGGEPVQASLSIVAADPAEMSLDEFVQAQIDNYNPGLTAEPATLGGQPALTVVGLPGQTANRQVFVAADGAVLQMIFGPLVEDAFPAQTAEMEQLYARVFETWAFLPAE